jgi:hypothetical protein
MGGGILPGRKTQYMKAKSVNNNLVGRKVLIDWPCRWRGAEARHVETLKAEAKAKEHYFGETGEIVAYNPAEESAKCLAICLDSTKEIVHVYDGAVTITTVSPREQDHAQVVDLLQQILEATKANSPFGG